jgi:hypothetical protein
MYAVTDERIGESSLTRLINEGFSPILMPPATYLQPAVSAHTDMLIFIGFDRLFCHRRYFESNRELIDKLCRISGKALTLSDEPTGEKYPLDVLFNACIVGKKLICNPKTVSRLILDAAAEQGFETVSVPQGYTKCSVAKVSDGAVITADNAIAEACRAAGIDVLLISEGHISLPPYNFGFIGGASGLCGDKVYFCGSLSSHPDGDRIREFCEKHKKTAISLSSGELQDVGSIYFLEA